MKKILILLFVLVLCACGPRTPQAELNETIDKMLVLIDHGESQELLVQYADLPDVKKSTIDISESNLKKLRLCLFRAREMQPVLSENGLLATYDDSSFPMPLKFTKTSGKWLLKN